MSLPSKSARSGSRGYAHLVEVNVPVGRVWSALTDPRLVQVWSSRPAEIDPREGGMYRVGNPQAGGREAHIDIFDVNRRLRLIYLTNPNDPTSDAAVVDDFILDARKGPAITSLRLLGSGVPVASEWDRTYVHLRMGWERNMARIKVMLESPPQPKKPKAVIPKDPPLPGLDY